MNDDVPHAGLTYERTYVRGGSKKCWCGKPRRKVKGKLGRYCLDCHARDARVRRKQARPKRSPRTRVKVAQIARTRRRLPSGLVVSKIDVQAAVAPVMARLQVLFDEAEAQPLGAVLEAWLDKQVSPLVNPLGVGYRFVWDPDGTSKHLLFDLRNFRNRIIVP